MEMQYKSGADATREMESRGGSDVKTANPRTVSSSELLLRLLALALTLIAAIVLAVSKETETTAVSVVPGLPPLDVAVTAKWQHMSATVYYMVSNCIACVYAALSLVLLIGGKSVMTMGLITMDLIMVALLFSGNGAAAAVGVIGYKGNSHVNWLKVCNSFGKFCSHATASLTISLLASLAFFFLVVLSASKLYKKSR